MNRQTFLKRSAPGINSQKFLTPAHAPFGRLVLLQTAAAKEATVDRRAADLADRLRAAARGDADVLGPAPAFAAKRAGSYRAQIVLRGLRPTDLLDRVDLGAEWTVDVDPMTLLG